MCVWGHCVETNTTQRCRFCGTKICTACLHGDFVGVAADLERCVVCYSGGKFLEALPNPNARAYTPEHLAEIRKLRAEEGGSLKINSKKMKKNSGKKKKKGTKK